MSMKKIQFLAQIVGFVTIAVLSIAGLFAVAGFVNPAWAQDARTSLSSVPTVINYQGMLRKPNGDPVNDTLSMTFKIYDSLAGGTVLHKETLNQVAVRDGLFTVLLGDEKPFDGDEFKGPLYIGIQVGSDAELSPRERIAPVPYAVQLTNGVYVGKDGKVGIGTTSPAVKLDVAGHAKVRENLTVDGNATVGGDFTANGNVTLGGAGKELSILGTVKAISNNLGGTGASGIKCDVGPNDDKKLANGTSETDGFFTGIATTPGTGAHYTLQLRLDRNRDGDFEHSMALASIAAHQGFDSPNYADSFTIPIPKDTNWELWCNTGYAQDLALVKPEVFWLWTPLGQ